jgi:soluble lytic murein transglycosylase
VTAARTARRKVTARPSRRTALRRRLLLLVGGLAAGAALVAALTPLADKAVTELTLPLRHDDIIRQQAADKNLDPALIAAVIYAESRFVDQTSPAGAKGLMQIMPATAAYIADLSGGTEFEQGDLASPQINIAYGSFYLRYLKDKYDGNDVLSLAAYNAGEGKVDEWLAGEDRIAVESIPFPETREYVENVIDARADYRRQYARELGL